MWNLEMIYFSLSIEGELDKLAAQRGLGDPRHRRDLRELITSTKLTISTCIFLLSYQDNYFKPQIVLDELKKIELTGEGILSEADFVLVASLISFITIDLKDDYDRERFTTLFFPDKLSEHLDLKIRFWKFHRMKITKIYFYWFIFSSSFCWIAGIIIWGHKVLNGKFLFSEPHNDLIIPTMEIYVFGWSYVLWSTQVQRLNQCSFQRLLKN